MNENLYTVTLVRVMPDAEMKDEIEGGFYSKDDVEKILIDFKFSSKDYKRFLDMQKNTFMSGMTFPLSDTLAIYIHRVQ